MNGTIACSTFIVCVTAIVITLIIQATKNL